MPNKFLITKKGLNKMHEELHILESVSRNAVINEISIAKQHGDLSENSEYKAAKEKQFIIESKISDLKKKIDMAEVVEIKYDLDTVRFGSTVLIENLDNASKAKYTILGDYESDVKNGIISISSPMSLAMIGKKKKEDFEVQMPNGETKYYIILDIMYENKE